MNEYIKLKGRCYNILYSLLVVQAAEPVENHRHVASH